MHLVIADKQRLSRLIAVFDSLFSVEFNTRLLGGVAEPVYIPAGCSAAEAIEDNSLVDICDYHRLYFRDDYFSSALHESAHWCIAGAERRLKVDFGYWYNPDGRSQKQQSVFERAETRPQALEWMFSVACGQRFRISADNLAADIGASEEFIQAVARQAQGWCDSSMPTRGERLAKGLAAEFEQPDYSCSDQYQQSKLI
jgi:elongation factor P hydroxylase